MSGKNENRLFAEKMKSLSAVSCAYNFLRDFEAQARKLIAKRDILCCANYECFEFIILAFQTKSLNSLWSHRCMKVRSDHCGAFSVV